MCGNAHSTVDFTSVDVQPSQL